MAGANWRPPRRFQCIQLALVSLVALSLLAGWAQLPGWGSSGSRAVDDPPRRLQGTGQGGAQSRQAKQAKQPKWAVATLVTGNFERGARALGCSLRRVARQHDVDMVALCYGLSEGQAATVEEGGWRCAAYAAIPNPFADSHWPMDYNKIIPFSLTQYDRVVLLDADVVAVNSKGLIELMQVPMPAGHVMAVRECVGPFLKGPRCPTCGSAAIEDEMQGGVVVLKPSARVFEDLKRAAPLTPSVDHGQQGFFSVFFRNNVTWLPARFNYVRSSYCVKLVDPDTGFYRLDESSMHAARSVARGEVEELARDHVSSGQVVFSHFHYQPKPWACDPTRPAECGAQWDGGDTHIEVLYKAWAFADAH